MRQRYRIIACIFSLQRTCFTAWGRQRVNNVLQLPMLKSRWDELSVRTAQFVKVGCIVPVSSVKHISVHIQKVGNAWHRICVPTAAFRSDGQSYSSTNCRYLWLKPFSRVTPLNSVRRPVGSGCFRHSCSEWLARRQVRQRRYSCHACVRGAGISQYSW